VTGRAAQVVSVFLCLVVTALAFGVFLLAGCGSSVGSVGGGRDVTSDWATTCLVPFDDNPNQTPRWMDIADNLYSSGFQQSFAYPDNTVELQYTTQETPLRFAVTAGHHALKPNFCYQMKLEGPSQAWSGDVDGSDFVNYQLGSNGRWWCDTCNTALTDAQVLSGQHNGHNVKGYLYFDFLVTGLDGSVNQTSTANSSYHVTWKTSQRSPTANDGPVRTYSVVADPDGWAYDRKHRSKTIGLYGEWEPGRALPGQVALAPETYSGVQFRLTEESFHSANPSGGNWRTVMVAYLPSFVISGSATPIHDLAVTAISVPGRPPRSGQTRDVVVTVYNEGTEGEQATVSLSDLTEGGAVPGGSVDVPVAAGQSATVSFAWTPTVRRDHTLEATVVPVTGETDLSDNTNTRTIGVK
jgi:hypothetical protein